MTFKHAGPISKFTLVELDERLYFELFDTLHEGIFGGNIAATARALDVNRLTAIKMITTPPKQRWWNQVIRQTITELMQNMAISRHKKIRARVPYVRKMLTDALHTGSLGEYIEWNENNNSGAVKYLLKTIARQPLHEISTRQLRLPAYSGGYSMRTLRQAAQVLQLGKETRGFGEEKETYWFIED